MNLIEQLGGYEKAKAKLHSMPLYSDKSLDKAMEIDHALLQYRREHEMYEVGDKVVCLYGQDSTFLIQDEIYTVKEVCYGGTHITLRLQENYDGGDSSYSINRFIHATDAEIKANKREVS